MDSIKAEAETLIAKFHEINKSMNDILEMIEFRRKSFGGIIKNSNNPETILQLKYFDLRNLIIRGIVNEKQFGRRERGATLSNWARWTHDKSIIACLNHASSEVKQKIYPYSPANLPKLLSDEERNNLLKIEENNHKSKMESTMKYFNRIFDDLEQEAKSISEIYQEMEGELKKIREEQKLRRELLRNGIKS
jgi:hypothetical protein